MWRFVQLHRRCANRWPEQNGCGVFVMFVDWREESETFWTLLTSDPVEACWSLRQTFKWKNFKRGFGVRRIRTKFCFNINFLLFDFRLVLTQQESHLYLHDDDAAGVSPDREVFKVNDWRVHLRIINQCAGGHLRPVSWPAQVSADQLTTRLHSYIIDYWLVTVASFWLFH